MSGLDTPMPRAVAALPRTSRGYPVPWFVSWVTGEDGDLREVPAGQGRPEFRIVGADRFGRAVRGRRCWICGGELSRLQAFVLGPMCGVNRTSSEPPSHEECALYAAKACPFLSDPGAVRRQHGLEDSVSPAGIMLQRNPGVALVWVAKRGSWDLFPDPEGRPLVNIGEPERVSWWCEGRPATREEVEASVEGGLPALREHATTTEARLELAHMVSIAKRTWPARAVAA